MTAMPPEKSYVVWHTQRTGSTLMCTTLEQTGIAGNPQEWVDSLAETEPSEAVALLRAVWHKQTSENGVFSAKQGYYESGLDVFMARFGQRDSSGKLDIKKSWSAVYPNCQHIVMTRRDKIKLAVSWWKSICGGPGHLPAKGGLLPWQAQVVVATANLEESYRFEAIRNLVLECVTREAALQNFLDKLGVVPLTITYEDFIQDYESTVRGVIDHIGVLQPQSIPEAQLKPTTDDINDAWVERFKADLATRKLSSA